MSPARELFLPAARKMWGWRRYFYPYRRLRFTREGWFFSALTLGLGLVAINTGHNLFYLLFALLLSAIIASGILSERVLRGIEVQRRVPEEITSRVPFAVVVEVKNPAARKISYSLSVSDGGTFFTRRTLGYLSALQPGESKRLHYLAQAPRRGLHHFYSIHLVSRFPFGFFEKVRLIPLEESCIAYPGWRETASLRALAARRELGGSKKWRWGEEIVGLRPALAEDDHRFIHWHTSARMAQLMVKEFAESVGHPALVFFDNRGEEGERFEQAVEGAASALRLLSSQGARVSFFTWDEEFEGLGSAEEMKAALRALALITPSRGGETGFLKWRAQASARGEGVFLRGDIPPPPSLPSCQVIQL